VSQFHLIIIGILIGLALVAILLISGIIPGFHLGGPSGQAVPITMWGTVPSEQFRDLIPSLNEQNKNTFTLAYVQKNPAVYESELINALASGTGPDIWLMSQDFILKDRDKIFPIPFESLSERTFKDTFISEGELYLTDKDIVALPFIIDPMVLYWNRDLFASAGISRVPKTWDEFVDFSQKLTVRDQAGNITQAGAALGEFKNIDHAEDIISCLILQTGNPIVNRAELKSTLTESGNLPISPAESAVRFFTEFSDPVKTTYSWNRSLPSSKNSFIGGTLAIYFGYASEYKEIAEKNPHLNFDVAEIPQIKGGNLLVTFANIQGLAISKSSPNLQQAMTAAVALIGKDSIAKISQGTFLPPVRRDLLAEAVQDPALSVFYKAAISSRGWLNPDSQEVFNMFSAMIESVLTGKKKIYDAVRDVSSKLDILLEKLKVQEKTQEQPSL
jgi:ABC-type glycerol-3-phosphate transport system substrate-binding protein